MRQALAPLWLAFVLLTTLPVGRGPRAGTTPRDQGRSVACYPLVGAVIGLLLWAVAWLAQSAPAGIVAVLVLVTWVVVTGGLHLDGLADAVDGGFAGHRDPARCLAVMADPAAGPMAVVALVGVLLAKFVALETLAAPATGSTPGPGVLVAVPMLARTAVAVLMATTAYRRANGIARDQAAHRSGTAIALASAGSVIVAAVVLSWVAALGLAVLTVLVAGLWRGFWQARIGGYTGDIAGGLIELVECVLLLALAWAGTAP